MITPSGEGRQPPLGGLSAGFHSDATHRQKAEMPNASENAATTREMANMEGGCSSPC